MLAAAMIESACHQEELRIMHGDEVVCVYTVTDPSQAEVIRGALQAEGIRCELGGPRQGGYTGLFEVEILVRALDAEQASEIIRTHQEREN